MKLQWSLGSKARIPFQFLRIVIGKETYRLFSDLLRPFKEVTVEISGDSYPTSLPLFNYLMDHITSKGKVYDSYLSNIDEKKQGYEYLPSRELCDDLRSAASLANEKLTGYYDVQSDFAFCATILDPRLNISYYELPERTKAQNLRKMESAKMEVLHYYNEMGYKPKVIQETKTKITKVASL